jgi:hypothetical protein
MGRSLLLNKEYWEDTVHIDLSDLTGPMLSLESVEGGPIALAVVENVGNA